MNDSSLLSDDALPLGFRFAAVRAGIKPSGNLDFAVALADTPANAAAMFTNNRVVAAPIIVGRKHLERSRGRVRAVVVNAGNANCATGQLGIDACLQVCAETAKIFACERHEVFPSSTGIIGVPLPAEKPITALPQIEASLAATPEQFSLFARAIMTTDTNVQPQDLRSLLQKSVESSFNRISIDGDTSTNDTILLLASGASGAKVSASDAAFSTTLTEVCTSLAKQIVDDGEGVTHVVELQIEGASTDRDALAIAKAIAHSPLVKTAWAGCDPNWGRLMAAAGCSGAAIDPERISIWFGNLPICRNGGRAPEFDEASAHEYLKQREFTIRLDFGLGSGSCRFWTTDLTVEYVHINADYST